MNPSPARRRARLASTLLTLLVGTLPALVAAAPPPTVIYTFPGCAPTLQGCLDVASEGAQVAIATNGPIDEDLSITKSVQLRAAAGFSPVFTPFSLIIARAPHGGDRHLVVQGITWEPAGSSGVIRVIHETNAAYTVELRDNTFTGITGATSGAVMSVATVAQPGTTLGPLHVVISGNEVDVPAGSETSPVSVQIANTPDATVRVEGNRIRTADHRQTSAIDVYHTEGDLALDVVRNVIASANPGQSAVNLWQLDDEGHSVARVMNNVITGFDGGMLFGISAYASGGAMDLTIVHNTVAYAALRAVQVGGRPDEGASATGLIANNVLVFSERSDVGIHEFGDTVVERRNLVTHIGGEDDAPSAPHAETIVVTDPRFAGPDDYRLEPASAGVNTASLALVPEDLASDIVRNPRVAGSAPDMGAYELPCEPDGTEPHCTKAPSCEITGCASDDPCSPTACVNDRCVVLPLQGIESARCVCDRPTPRTCDPAALLKGVTRRVDRACTHLERATAPKTPRQYPRLLVNADRAVQRAATQAERRALAGQISSDCATDLAAAFKDARERIRSLLE